ncbi:NAD(P)H dehydrogenase C1 [Wolffia australiana]
MAAAQGMISTAVAVRMPFGSTKSNLKRFYVGQRFKNGMGRMSISSTVKSMSNNNNAETLQESQDSRGPSYIWSDKQRPRVCILGGGFGGLYTALRLESLVWTDNKKPQVVLIDKSENFVFKPLMYELLSGEVEPWEIAPAFKDLLANTGVLFVKDSVKIIQPNGPGEVLPGGNVQLESGLNIEYDWLVLALGSEAKLDVAPGALEYALPFSTLDDAQRTDQALKKLERARFGKSSLPIEVAIVGCGYSGVELAATIAERLQDRGTVTAINVDANICPTGLPGNREAALKVISERNVQLLLGFYVNCVRKPADADESDNQAKFILDLQPAQRGIDSKSIEADLILWTVGAKSLLPQLESFDYGKRLPLTSRGQAEIDETLQVKGHPRIFALGDSAALRDNGGRLLPATAQVAFQQADFAGWNIWAAINGRPLLPFRFQNLGEMMTLGMNDAAVTPGFIEGLTLEGPIAHTARKLVYLARLPTDEHRLKVGISWLAKSTIDSIALLQGSISKVLSSS